MGEKLTDADVTLEDVRRKRQHAISWPAVLVHVLLTDFFRPVHSGNRLGLGNHQGRLISHETETIPV